MIKNVNILGIIYTIEEVEVVNKEQYLLGEINYITQTIKIDKTLTEERKKLVLWHEIMHGILELLGLDDLNSNEQIVQAIAVALNYLTRN